MIIVGAGEAAGFLFDDLIDLKIPRFDSQVYSWPIVHATMANLYYNDRLIIAHASLNQSTKLWGAGAEITWKRDGERYSHTIGGLADRFKTVEEAERFVITLAKAWIDADS